jgi:hypothetical protein
MCLNAPIRAPFGGALSAPADEIVLANFPLL